MILERSLFSLIFLLLHICLFAQNNALVLRNDAFIVLNGGTAGTEAVLVINQSNPNGIISTGTGGNIITQGEFDYIKWNVQAASGNYVVPFTADVANVKIPLTVNITSAGTGTGYLALSSWDVSAGAGSFNNTPYPSEVSHMAGANGQADVSEYAVDRYWIMDVNDPLGTGQTFGAEPVATLGFGYNTAAAETGDGNALAMGNLGAQRYNGAVNKWYGWFSGGVANSIWGTDDGLGNVTGVPSGTPWYRTWTLADISEPLPIDLTYFDAQCKEEGVVIQWETASELNNDYFEILKSTNGVDFEVLVSLDGTGNSNSTTSYTHVDNEGAASNSYYKLIQVDYDGGRKEYETVVIKPCIVNEDITVYSGVAGEIILEMFSNTDGDYEVVIYDALGKQINGADNVAAVEGYNRFSLKQNNLAFGTYLVTISNEYQTRSQKLILK